MNFDLKKNNYLLSLIAGIIGTVICFTMDKITSNDKTNNEIDYMKYIKTCVVISICVLCSLLYIRSNNNVKDVTENISMQVAGGNTNSPNIESTGLQEVNINQNIHTGNPQF